MNRAHLAPTHNFMIILASHVARPPYNLVRHRSPTTPVTPATTSHTAPLTTLCIMMSTSSPSPYSCDGEVAVNMEDGSVHGSAGEASPTIETEQEGEELAPVPPVNDSTVSITEEVMNSDPGVFSPQRLTVVGRSRLGRKLREMNAAAKNFANAINLLDSEIRALQKIRNRCMRTTNTVKMVEEDNDFMITTITLFDDNLGAFKTVRDSLYMSKDVIHKKIRDMENETPSVELDIEIYPTGLEGV